MSVRDKSGIRRTLKVTPSFEFTVPVPHNGRRSNDKTRRPRLVRRRQRLGLSPRLSLLEGGDVLAPSLTVRLDSVLPHDRRQKRYDLDGFAWRIISTNR